MFLIHLFLFSTFLAQVFGSPVRRPERTINQAMLPQDNSRRNHQQYIPPTVPQEQPSEFTNWHNESRQRMGRNESIRRFIPLASTNSVSNRDKAMRLKAIERFILSALRPSSSSPSISTNEITDQKFPDEIINPTPQQNELHQPQQHKNNHTFPGALNSYSASCDFPNKVDEDAWIQPGFFRIYFKLEDLLYDNKFQQPMNISSEDSQNISTTTANQDQGRIHPNQINIISAKLRLYKIGRGPNAEPDRFELPMTSEFCNNTNEQIAAHIHQKTSNVLPTSTTIVSEVPEERIFVKVYWYTAPVTKRHFQKKLLFSRTLLVKESGWVDFDIQKAAKTWLDSKINYGLEIEVENEDNDLVDVNTYFGREECTGFNRTAIAKQYQSPFSRIGRVSATQSKKYPAPVLELCTLTLPLTPDKQEPMSYPMSSFTVKRYQEEETQWPNDDIFSFNSTTTTTTLPPYFHRHRHHHGSRTVQNQHRRDNQYMQADSPIPRQQIETTTQFSLDDDHPLKRIFATAKTYLSSKEMYKRQRQRDYNNWNQDDENEEEDEGSRFQPIIVRAENVIIENNDSKR